MTRVLHIALTNEWDAGRAAGAYDMSSRGRTLADEGFIHCSTARQAPGVLTRFYGDVHPADLTMLVLDTDALEAAGSPVKWDPVPGQPDPFPHVYGPITPGAVVGELPVVGELGSPTLPDLGDWDVAGSAG